MLEAGGYYDEADFNRLELVGLPEPVLARRPAADRRPERHAPGRAPRSAAARSINWTNCLRTRPWVREQWAREHGLTGLDGPEFDAPPRRGLERALGVNDRCSDLNGPQQRMQEGAEALGWSFRTILRNTDQSRYDPASAGYIGFGDRSGAKQIDARRPTSQDAVAARRRVRRRLLRRPRS